MKFGKKTTAMLAFLVGSVVFATAALADVAIGSGYNSLKNAAKETMARLAKDTDNFQVEAKLSLKLDGREFVRDNVSAKMDIANKTQESYAESLSDDGEAICTYSYSDTEIEAYKGEADGKYSVFERSDVDKGPMFENPFEEEVAQDAEKVLDAFVGSLSDIIQMEELDGKTMYVGNLTETQVPMLVNALTSFAVKYSFMNDYAVRSMKLPKIENDFCVRSASGKAIQDENGMLTDAIGNITLAGTDKNGDEHEITAEISLALFEIGTTVVVRPELTEENSEWIEAKDTSSDGVLSEQQVGVYKNDIVETDGNALRKVGERFLEITEAGNGVCSGNYHETYIDGYEPKNPIEAFTFTEQQNGSANNIYGEYVLCKYENGESVNMIIRPYHGANSTKLEILYNVKVSEDGSGYSSECPEDFDELFVRVFE